MAETCEVLVVLVPVSESDMNHDVFFPYYDEDVRTGTGVERSLRIASHEIADRSSNSPTLGIGETTARLSGLPSTMRGLDRVLSTICVVLYTSGMSGIQNLHSRSSFPRFVSALKVIRSTLNCRYLQSSEHCEELQCHVEEDAAEKRVAKTVTNSSIWIVLTLEEQLKIESRGCADSRRVSC